MECYVHSVQMHTFVLVWSPYSNVIAFNCADYIWETGYCC